jgi:hypothetical protein
MIIAVSSCWAYRDAWKPFFELFRRFWPDCRYPVYLLTDRFDNSISDVEPFIADGSWGQLLAKFAQNHRETSILLLLEDYFFNAPVQSDAIEEALDIMKTWDALACRLYPHPGANQSVEWSETWGLISREEDYRISCMAGIWKPIVLHTLASQFDTPWAFEVQGTALTQRYAGDIYSWKRSCKPWPLDYPWTGILRGQWNPEATRLFETLKMDVDLSQRPISEELPREYVNHYAR